MCSATFVAAQGLHPVQHLLGTAAGWGGNPVTDAFYTGAAPDRNDGRTVYRLTVRDVPVDGFWSISVYNKDGFFEKNDRGVYSLNNVTAARDADGSVTIQFGGCPPSLHSGGTGNNPQLHPDLGRLELRRPTVSPAEGSARRIVEVPGGDGRALNGL